MAEELNQQASSQSVSQTEPNAAVKQSQPVASSMTPSQQSDYYNKTQELAQGRRALDAEKAKFEQERSAFLAKIQPQQNPQNSGYSNQNPNTLPASPELIPNYAELAQQFGVEGANAILGSLTKIAQPVQSELAETQKRLAMAEFNTLVSQISNRGKELYGEQAWKDKGEQVLQVIMQYNGLPLEKAWWVVNGETAHQQGIDKAYQSQQQKQTENVSTNKTTTDNTVQSVNSFGDAFESAWQQHSS